MADLTSKDVVLLACPFCGGSVEVGHYHPDLGPSSCFVKCWCGARGTEHQYQHGDHKEAIAKAAASWNRRTVETSADDTEDMANIGRALMERLPKDYHWNDCPTEIVTDLLNQIHDLKRAPEEPRETSGWRSIETAPKDQAILLRFRPEDAGGGTTNPGVVVAYWDAYYAPGGNGNYDKCSPWVIADCGETVNLHYSGDPTGWMPLPAITPEEPSRCTHPSGSHSLAKDSTGRDYCTWCDWPAVKAAQHAITCPCHPYQEKAAVRDCSCGAVKASAFPRPLGTAHGAICEFVREKGGCTDCLGEPGPDGKVVHKAGCSASYIP